MQLESRCSHSLSLRLRLFTLTSLHPITRRLIMQKARGHPDPRRDHRAPTACRHTVSGSISLPSPGFFSPFPHGTGSLSVIRSYLALEGGPPRFPPDNTCPVVLGIPSGRRSRFRLRGHHPVSPGFPAGSANATLSYSLAGIWPRLDGPTTPT
jgi:hypothetical protein